MEQFPLPNRYAVEPNGDHRATLSIEPLYPGYGTTIGNALRRVLLSSLPGTAVTSVKIPRVDHEFSTIEGIKEDVVHIILNLKQLHVKMHTETPQVLKLSVNKTGAVTAGDFEDNSEVEVVNKDLVLANVTDKEQGFEMEITVERGRGYVPVEQRKGEDLGIGVIAIDAIYSPVKKVGYAIENVRVGQRTDFDKVLLDIETDGSITPEEAFVQASSMLVDHFNVIMGEGVAPVVAVEEGAAAEETESEILVSSLDLATRTENVLTKAGIATVSQLVATDNETLLELDGFGQAALEEVDAALAKLGMERKG
ncbi:MAG: DNA-directed RNA polymerase subunit alpha [Candidatus Andersenbacteria bacterium]|nr:DNA-directed RNA polymerase subunit alpha [Candidatus Andersenbacteria bacterium]